MMVVGGRHLVSARSTSKAGGPRSVRAAVPEGERPAPGLAANHLVDTVRRRSYGGAADSRSAGRRVAAAICKKANSLVRALGAAR
ncbi:hypothetical protein EVAR_42934_1 [Eumeta japonica]|uniref:Uncharacterized protein n=1 Tax=Eumeta variegata TaxID=151549 RepID=A0A4C1WXE1_EUMVA|nr:hypothetical protein EVAR_42934_1 [Eumeta japonica]